LVPPDFEINFRGIGFPKPPFVELASPPGVLSQTLKVSKSFPVG
jgi:hypothetical protein